MGEDVLQAVAAAATAAVLTRLLVSGGRLLQGNNSRGNANGSVVGTFAALLSSQLVERAAEDVLSTVARLAKTFVSAVAETVTAAAVAQFIANAARFLRGLLRLTRTASTRTSSDRDNRFRDYGRVRLKGFDLFRFFEDRLGRLNRLNRLHRLHRRERRERLHDGLKVGLNDGLNRLVAVVERGSVLRDAGNNVRVVLGLLLNRRRSINRGLRCQRLSNRRANNNRFRGGFGNISGRRGNNLRLGLCVNRLRSRGNNLGFRVSNGLRLRNGLRSGFLLVAGAGNTVVTVAVTSVAVSVFALVDGLAIMTTAAKKVAKEVLGFFNEVAATAARVAQGAVLTA